MKALENSSESQKYFIVSKIKNIKLTIIYPQVCL